MTITPEQCRAARELLGWTQTHLAAKARVNGDTVRRFESRERTSYPKTIAALERVLRVAGVDFVAGGEDGQAAGAVRRSFPVSVPA